MKKPNIVAGIEGSRHAPPVVEIVERLIAQAKQRQRSVVLPEGDDPRILQAARRLHDDGICPAHPDRRAGGVGRGRCKGWRFARCNREPGADRERRARRLRGALPRRPAQGERAGGEGGCSPSPCSTRRWRSRRENADVLVAGASQPTARVIEAGLMSVGLADGIATPSSFFIMVPARRRRAAGVRRLRGQRRPRCRGACGHRYCFPPRAPSGCSAISCAGGDALVLHPR